jgi:glycosyltransferase involved in cell wall biosynthesis
VTSTAATAGAPDAPEARRARDLKVVLVYRVLFHWRTPVFRRLARWPGIRFVALHGSDFPGTKTVNGRDLSGFEHHELWTLRLVSKVTDAREITFPLWPGLPFRLWREHPDVILAEGGSNLPMVTVLVLFARLLGIPVVWWSLGEIPHPGPLRFTQRVFRGWVRFLERRCQAWLGYSSLAGDYFRRCGYPEERCFVAVNVVDTDAVRERLPGARAAAGPLRERLGLQGKRVLLFVGALAPYKRVEDLIAVYARLRTRHPDLRLLVVGGGPHREVLEQHARDLGADDAIFTGEVVEGVGPYFELGDILVLPGLGGLAISEAMTHGLPVVATLADGCEVDLVQEGHSGYVLESGDLDALESRIEEMLGDPERLAEMGANGRRIIDEQHDIGRYLENMVAALECGAAQGRRARRDADQA